jgi:hypothetical protein
MPVAGPGFRTSSTAAEMIQRASERSVAEASDRADVWHRFEAVLTAEAGLTRREAA